jgi:hypothetical protein
LRSLSRNFRRTSSSDWKLIAIVAPGGATGKGIIPLADSCAEYRTENMKAHQAEEQVGLLDAVRQYLYQLACCKPEERFRIANTSPTPASIKATELGSGVATGVKVNTPVSVKLGVHDPQSKP